MLLIKKRFPMLWPSVRRAASRLGGEHPREAETPADRLHLRWWKERHRAKVEEAGRGPFDFAVVGDSITHFWETTGREEWARCFAGRRPLNLGFDGDLTEHVLWRMRNGEWPVPAPGRTLLLAGTNNNIRFESVDATVAGLRAIVRAMRERTPAAPITLLCLFPRNGRHAWTRVRNDAVNARLPALAREEKVDLLDLRHLFVDARGDLDRTALPDQLHPGPIGYARWADALLAGRGIDEAIAGSPSRRLADIEGWKQA